MDELDLKDMGIDVKTNAAYYDIIQYYDALNPRIRRIDLNNLYYANVAGKMELVPGSSVTINGVQYTVQAHLGGGTFGKVARVLASNGYFYALKVQFTEVGPGGEDSRFMKYLEAINHCITCYNSEIDGHLRVPLFYQIGVDDATGHVFYIMELIQSTAHSLLITHGVTPSERAVLARDFLRESALLFRQLWDLLRFNHGDCKSDNIGISADGRFKLLDFGFSNLTIPGVGDIPIVMAVNTPMRGRDLTQLTFNLYDYGFAENDGPEFYTLVKNSMRNILEMNGCNLTMLPQVCFGENIAEWDDTYQLLNEHDNPKGYATPVYNTMRILTRNNPVYSGYEVPPYPAPPEGYLPPPYLPPLEHENLAIVGPAALPPAPPAASPAGPGNGIPAAAAPVPPAIAAAPVVPAPVVPAPAEVAPVHPAAVPAAPMGAIAAAGVGLNEHWNNLVNMVGGGLGYIAGWVPGLRGGGQKKKMNQRRRKITHKVRKHVRKSTRKSTKRRAV
jgi:serine/threonine protein kinase